MSGSRGPTQIHIRGLCHWAGYPAGHLGAESPSRRTARPASARKSSPPCPHRLHGLFRARCANAMSRCLRALPFASSRRSLTHTLGHLQWPEPPRFVHATAPARGRLKIHRHRAIRSLARYGGARAIRDSPSDVAACHRVVRRHTCCSPATRRSMRATQARATPGVNVGQPAPKAASKLSYEARRSSEECVGSARIAPSQLRIVTIRHGLKVFVLILPCFGHFGWPFPRWDGPPEKKSHLESGLNQRDRATGGFVVVYTHRKPGKIFYWRGFT